MIFFSLARHYHIFSTALSRCCGGVPAAVLWGCRWCGRRVWSEDVGSWQDRARDPTALHSPQQFTEQFQIRPLLFFCCSIHVLLFSCCSMYARSARYSLLEISRGRGDNGKYIFMSFIVEIRVYSYIYFISDIITL